MDTFEWHASESAPGTYPMEIVSGLLLYKGQESGLYVPHRVTLAGSNIVWGHGRSAHVTGAQFKPLPDRLQITFFSYAENRFYQGEFPLPYETILTLFRTGYYDPSAKHQRILRKSDVYRKKHRALGLAPDRAPYTGMVVGVAPGGSVAVWVVGPGVKTEVFFGQAEPVEYEWTRFFDNPNTSREAFVQMVLADALKDETPERLEALARTQGVIPVDRWADYRTRYPWQPVFSGMAIRESEGMGLYSFNGEMARINYPVSAAESQLTRVVPEGIGFIWIKNEHEGLSFNIKFTEEEILAAFEKLGKHQQPLSLEMRMSSAEESGALPIFSVWLRNDSEAVQLKQQTISHQRWRYSKDDPDGDTVPLGVPMYQQLP